MVNKILIDTNVLLDYLLEREPYFENAKKRREVLTNLCTIFDVEGIDKAKLLSGLANEEFSDFATSKIKAIEPKDYLKL